MTSVNRQIPELPKTLALLDRRVHLFLHVKVAPKWLDDPGHDRDLGLEFPR